MPGGYCAVRRGYVRRDTDTAPRRRLRRVSSPRPRSRRHRSPGRRSRSIRATTAATGARRRDQPARRRRHAAQGLRHDRHRDRRRLRRGGVQPRRRAAARARSCARAARGSCSRARPNDGWGPCITERAAIGNRAHADAAISIHADGGPAGGRGFHVIYPPPIAGPDRRHRGGVAPARGRGPRRVRAGTGEPHSTYAGRDGLDVRSDLGGLNLSDVPKVFIETGNMRNAADAARLESAAYRQREAAPSPRGSGRSCGCSPGLEVDERGRPDAAMTFAPATPTVSWGAISIDLAAFTIGARSPRRTRVTCENT